MIRPILEDKFMLGFLPTRVESTALLLLVGSYVIADQVAAASDWPRFRGPNGSDIADGNQLPTRLDRKRTFTGKLTCQWAALLQSSPAIASGSRDTKQVTA
jgi:hypothetical protein